MTPEEYNEKKQQDYIDRIRKQTLSTILSKEAYERLARVRLVDPHFAGQVELYLIQIYQQGKLDQHISDQKLREVLEILSKKKDITIKRK